MIHISDFTTVSVSIKTSDLHHKLLNVFKESERWRKTSGPERQLHTQTADLSLTYVLSVPGHGGGGVLVAVEVNVGLSARSPVGTVFNQDLRHN